MRLGGGEVRTACWRAWAGWSLVWAASSMSAPRPDTGKERSEVRKGKGGCYCDPGSCLICILQPKVEFLFEFILGLSNR